MSARRLRILFFLLHPGYLRVYEAPLRVLAERGHEVHLAFAREGGHVGGMALPEQLHARYASITYSYAPERPLLDGWRSVAWLVRGLGDLARYADPRYDDAPALRNRMSDKVLGHLADSGGFDPLTRRLALRIARRLAHTSNAERARRGVAAAGKLESALPTSRRSDRFVAAHRPDVVLATPVVELASTQVDALRSARRLGIPTGVCVASWDNLSSKGLLRLVPERVFVWNEIQREEAVTLHGIPPERVVATGAPRFDEWFERRPSTTREEFAAKTGLDPSRPFVLYLASSSFIAADESAFVRRWIDALRRAEDPLLAGCGVMIRPYPKHMRPWRGFDASELTNVTVWPPGGAEPDDGEARADFFDSLAHSAAVVGASTSAMIEAAIVGRDVFSVIDSTFAQETTIHFHYLIDERGGFLHVAPNLEQHVRQLARALHDGVTGAEQRRRFVESFVRPHGLDRPATPIFVDAVEELAAVTAVQPERRAPLLARAALATIAATSSATTAFEVARAAARSRRGSARRTSPARAAGENR